MTIDLTAEQQAIVAHDEGPALVFAVAGAGKTTAMIHRIERLVRERIFDADRILATSFNRDAVHELRSRLEQWHYCRPVRTRTLHGLGYYIIRQAAQRGLVPEMSVEDARTILYETLRVARARNVEYREELETLDHDDFLSYVGSCKGNLAYADLAGTPLPDHARETASQAKAPEDLGWYLDLYRLFEAVRTRSRAITYDDMLVGGWALMITYPRLGEYVRGLFDCVMVDEFQDINLAQSEMLDLITSPHRNYMAIGDDDQTIYEWRGATPAFILNFAERYDARTYKMTANFRSTASQIALANNVIVHNETREPKTLRCMRDASGSTELHVVKQAQVLGRQIVDVIDAALTGGVPSDEIVVLVRFYAQTTYIEQHLIEREIPYVVVGSSPFYDRPEVITLLAYCRLAQFERSLIAGETLNDDEVREFTAAWTNVYNRPNRYISRRLARSVRDTVVLHDKPITRVLNRISADAEYDRVAERILVLCDDLTWLASVVDTEPAHTILEELESRLDYMDFLRETSGFPETGAGKVANVSAIIDYARGKGTINDFTAYLEQISYGRAGGANEQQNPIELMTVFRAKGREWEHVFVPDVNQGVIPFSGSDNLEEERRLFYVAVTRAKQHLHLYCMQDAPISQFLEEADYRRTLDAVHGQPTHRQKTKRHTRPVPKPSEKQTAKERPSEFLQRIWRRGELG